MPVLFACPIKEFRGNLRKTLLMCEFNRFVPFATLRLRDVKPFIGSHAIQREGLMSQLN